MGKAAARVALGHQPSQQHRAVIHGRQAASMGGSKGGSVGSYSSGSADNVGNVLDKYGANETGGKIAKVIFTRPPILYDRLRSFPTLSNPILSYPILSYIRTSTSRFRHLVWYCTTSTVRRSNQFGWRRFFYCFLCSMTCMCNSLIALFWSCTASSVLRPRWAVLLVRSCLYTVLLHCTPTCVHTP